jgi:hypothetical protein
MDQIAIRAEQGILNEFTGQSRNRRFRYQRYIDLFSEPAPTEAAS